MKKIVLSLITLSIVGSFVFSHATPLIAGGNGDNFFFAFIAVPKYSGENGSDDTKVYGYLRDYDDEEIHQPLFDVNCYVKQNVLDDYEDCFIQGDLFSKSTATSFIGDKTKKWSTFGADDIAYDGSVTFMLENLGTGTGSSASRITKTIGLGTDEMTEPTISKPEIILLGGEAAGSFYLRASSYIAHEDSNATVYYKLKYSDNSQPTFGESFILFRYAVPSAYMTQEGSGYMSAFDVISCEAAFESSGKNFINVYAYINDSLKHTVKVDVTQYCPVPGTSGGTTGGGTTGGTTGGGTTGGDCEGNPQGPTCEVV